LFLLEIEEGTFYIDSWKAVQDRFVKEQAP
jgi:hypothetical protein